MIFKIAFFHILFVSFLLGNQSPDSVRYRYARQLFLNGQDNEALVELEKLMTSPEYKDRATYIKAAALARQDKINEAQHLLTHLQDRLVKSRSDKISELKSSLYEAELEYELIKIDRINQTDVNLPPLDFEALKTELNKIEEKKPEALIFYPQNKKLDLQDLERLLKEHPEDNTILLALADLYFDSNVQKSIQLLKSRNQPSDTANYLLGISYLYNNETENAKNTFQDFLNRFPESSYADEIRFRLGEIYFNSRKYPEAKSHFKQILNNRHSNLYIHALYKTAWVSYLQNNFGEAIQQFAQLLDVGSEGSDVLKEEATRYLAISLLENSQTPALLGEKSWIHSVWTQFKDLLAKQDIHLNPNKALKKSLVAQYLENPETREVAKPLLLELAAENRAKGLFKESAENYALFIENFPKDSHLDQVLFYHSESLFDAHDYHAAAVGFEKVRDGSFKTTYRQKAALNAIYAYQQEIKQTFPQIDLSKIDLAQQGHLQENIASILLAFVNAIDILKEKFQTASQVPAFLFQAAGIYVRSGDMKEARKRLEQLAWFYPKHEAARIAAHLLIRDSLNHEQWLEAAENARRFRDLSQDFRHIETSARFKYANQLFSEAKTPQENQEVSRLYLEILKENPKTEIADKILFNAAMASQSKDLFEKVFVNYPHSPLAKSAKEKHASYIVQEDYHRLETAMQSYQALSASQLAQKAKQLTELQKAYEKIIARYKLSIWTLACLYQIGNLYEDLLGTLQTLEFSEDKMSIVRRKAMDAYQLVIDTARGLSEKGEWVSKAESALSRLSREVRP